MISSFKWHHKPKYAWIPFVSKEIRRQYFVLIFIKQRIHGVKIFYIANIIELKVLSFEKHENKMDLHIQPSEEGHDRM